MSENVPVVKLGKSRCCTKRASIQIRKLSCLLKIALRTDSQYMTAYCMGLYNLFLVSTKQTRVPYLSGSKQIYVTSLQNITHFQFSILLVCCPFILHSFLSFILFLFTVYFISFNKLSGFKFIIFYQNFFSITLNKRRILQI